eukprot:6173595-Pleurochrysis_carterae.AAC.5
MGITFVAFVRSVPLIAAHCHLLTGGGLVRVGDGVADGGEQRLGLDLLAVDAERGRARVVGRRLGLAHERRIAARAGEARVEGARVQLHAARACVRGQWAWRIREDVRERALWSRGPSSCE